MCLQRIHSCITMQWKHPSICCMASCRAEAAMLSSPLESSGMRSCLLLAWLSWKSFSCVLLSQCREHTSTLCIASGISCLGWVNHTHWRRLCRLLAVLTRERFPRSLLNFEGTHWQAVCMAVRSKNNASLCNVSKVFYLLHVTCIGMSYPMHVTYPAHHLQLSCENSEIPSRMKRTDSLHTTSQAQFRLCVTCLACSCQSVQKIFCAVPDSFAYQRCISEFYCLYVCIWRLNSTVEFDVWIFKSCRSLPVL